ncbi:hypothetical protein PSQ90_14925 [Devosia rhodophyticola]|uniref:Uncharacterized protein n=1 Tax=Devosia rhodophyticola TaxID=3026423 RepID=A0ABY7YXM8_9HYPH|nr:hypothetical protein [Devosia rhodophyticola]WDR05550.1 hypothetical protein PSQ90_14925 [Devosia rhodophyticola]
MMAIPIEGPEFHFADDDWSVIAEALLYHHQTAFTDEKAARVLLEEEIEYWISGQSRTELRERRDAYDAEIAKLKKIAEIAATVNKEKTFDIPVPQVDVQRINEWETLWKPYGLSDANARGDLEPILCRWWWIAGNEVGAGSADGGSGPLVRFIMTACRAAGEACDKIRARNVVRKAKKEISRGEWGERDPERFYLDILTDPSQIFR